MCNACGGWTFYKVADLVVAPAHLPHPHQGDKALVKSLTPDDSKENGDKLCVLQAWGDSFEFAIAASVQWYQAPVLIPMRPSAVFRPEQHHSGDLYGLNLGDSSWDTPLFLLELGGWSVLLCFSVLITSKSLQWTALFHLCTWLQVSFPLGQALALSLFVRPLFCATDDSRNI